MKVTPLAIPEVLRLEPRVFGDERGYFLETHSVRSFEAAGISAAFVQDNTSFSSRGTLRGLHLQNPGAQGKLVMALSGSVFDVAVDVRVGSPTFGKWIGEELSEENHRQLYIPPGFAHGFLVLSETARFAYKCTTFYDPSSEVSLRFDDPELGIVWPDLSQLAGAGVGALLSEKDRSAPTLSELVTSGRLPTYQGQGAR